MSLLLDTSVIVASLDSDEPHHARCDRLLARGGHKLYSHGLAETFAILTGGVAHAVGRFTTCCTWPPRERLALRPW